MSSLSGIKDQQSAKVAIQLIINATQIPIKTMKITQTTNCITSNICNK